MDIDYTRSSNAGFEQTLTAVQEAAVRNNFRVLHTHDVQKTLAEKGFSIPPYSIVEVCNASFAYKVLSINKSVGMMLPCRIVVYEEEGGTVVRLLKPTIMSDIMPRVALGSIPAEVEGILVTVVDEAVQ